MIVIDETTTFNIKGTIAMPFRSSLTILVVNDAKGISQKVRNIVRIYFAY